MIVTVVPAGEAGFWVVLALGLAARYLLRWRRTGAALLLCLPLVDLLVLGATVLDLRQGAAARASHGLAAAYVGFTAAYGHSLVVWADARFAHRFAGGPKPPAAPKYGRARAAHEWRIFRRTLLAAGLTVALVSLMILLVDDPARTGALTAWYPRTAWVTGISLVVAASYTVFPKRPR
ncbi:hypothetical protein GCM10018781_08500 [Kitasatospora indigofera]|uniref:Uncharacterized protein n=1 Tax=Kitasatospora indigofera TaxID=67307 RepID=A0A919FD31_9ACTN|nr:hypothetical protein [Kitasatospora indigofera]GHH61688.1 hypothetical protein GCM10018781_08500 [Kitasatospora indigofera]